MVGVAASAFPTTLLSASLPDIAADLNASTSVISWVQAAPSIVFAVGMPLFGKLGDMYGHRRTFVVGFAAMTIGSLATSMSWNVGALIGFRTIAQLAGAATSTAAFGLIAGVFERQERTRAISLYTSVLAMSPVVAVVVGGPIIEHIGWRWLFVFQAVPASIATFVGYLVLPETPRKPTVRFDTAGALLLALTVTALLFAINRSTPWGWTHPTVIGGLALFPVLLAVFVRLERRTHEPLLPVRKFAQRQLALPILTNGVLQMSYILAFTFAPFMISRLLGYKTSKTAFIIALRPVAFSLAAWYSGRHNDRFSVRSFQVVGNTTVAVAALITAAGAWQRSLGLIIAGLVLSGLGVGYGRPSNAVAITNAVTESDVGIATGVQNMISTIGSAIGATLSLAIIDDHVTSTPFVHTSLIAAAIGVVSVWLGAQTLRRTLAKPVVPAVRR